MERRTGASTAGDRQWQVSGTAHSSAGVNAVAGDRPDLLTLTGLRATGHHGVFDHERRDGQEFIVDLVVATDFAAAAATDHLGNTIHYGVLAEQVTAAIERDPVDLIETLAERIAAVVLEYPAATSVTVTVHKPHAPITVPFDDVAVTMTRSRR